MMRFLFVFVFFVISFFGFSQSDIDSSIFVDQIVVTATKIKEESKDLARTVYIIDSTELRANSGKTLAQILNQIPGLYIAESNGNMGSPQSYSLRGGREKDALFLLNGQAIGDASHISTFADLNLITASEVERIEVVYGSSSTLYGSSASAGVVNIILKKPEGKVYIDVHSQVGKWYSFDQSWRVGGSSLAGKLNYGIHANWMRTDGFSAAVDSLGRGDFDDDSSRQYGYTAYLTVNPTNTLSIPVSYRSSQLNYDFDGGAFLDSDDKQRNKSTIAQFSPEFTWQNSQLTLNAQIELANRIQFNSSSPRGDDRVSQFSSKTTDLDLFYAHDISQSFKVLGGLNYRESASDQYGVEFFSGMYQQNIAADSASFSSIDPYVGLQYGVGNNLSLDGGARVTNHSSYGSDFNYHLAAAYALIESSPNIGFNSVIRAELSSAFITPSIFQLYSSFGNQDLEAESSQTYSVGLVNEFSNKANLAVSGYFRQESQPIIFSNSTFAYDNGSDNSFARGIEAELSLMPNEHVNGKAFIHLIDRKRRAEMYRLPNRTWGMSAILQPKPIPGLSFYADYRRVGERIMPLFNNSTFMVDEIEVEGYNNLNFTANVKIPDGRWNIYLSARNVSDEDIIQNLGYNAEDFNLKLGLNYNYSRNALGTF